jgi:iron-sulfur cluster assembly accessory protein
MNCGGINMSVTLTENAVKKIKEIYSQDSELAGKALRIFIEKGGCSGYSYGFKFDDAAAADRLQEYDGFKLAIDPESGEKLEGSTVDYKEDFGQEGFAIQNPNAKKSCGCGNSFEA